MIISWTVLNLEYNIQQKDSTQRTTGPEYFKYHTNYLKKGLHHWTRKTQYPKNFPTLIESMLIVLILPKTWLKKSLVVGQALLQILLVFINRVFLGIWILIKVFEKNKYLKTYSFGIFFFLVFETTRCCLTNLFESISIITVFFCIFIQSLFQFIYFEKRKRIKRIFFFFIDLWRKGNNTKESSKFSFNQIKKNIYSSK